MPLHACVSMPAHCEEAKGHGCNDGRVRRVPRNSVWPRCRALLCSGAGVGSARTMAAAPLGSENGPGQAQAFAQLGPPAAMLCRGRKPGAQCPRNRLLDHGRRRAEGQAEASTGWCCDAARGMDGGGETHVPARASLPALSLNGWHIRARWLLGRARHPGCKRRAQGA